ncbi:MAG: hypothetical protein LBK56_06845, partial [Gracilibacteraceae bacterium]|nr:hypothetical protein [Gracilibacteraceae bacterium]
MSNITSSGFSVFDVKEPMDLLTLIRKNRAALAEFRGEPTPAPGLFDTFAKQPLSSEETEEMTRIQTMYQDLHCSIRPMVRVTSGFGNSD